jgi:hypothetical protein
MAAPPIVRECRRRFIERWQTKRAWQATGLRTDRLRSRSAEAAVQVVSQLIRGSLRNLFLCGDSVL